MKPKFSILLCFCAICGCFASASAQDDCRTVVVTTATGSVLKFDLAEGVDVAFSDTEMKITAKSSEVSLPLTDFARFDFSSEATGSVTDVTASAKVRVCNGTISVSGLLPHSDVALFSTGGILVCNAQCDGTGCFSSPTLSPGIYILKTNVTTIKFLIKQ